MDASASRDNPIDSIHSQSQAQKGLVRNQIACERCRLHKQKCDGASPCSKCAQRGVTCAYRVKKRPRRKPRAVASPGQGTAASTAAELCSLFPSVRASQDVPGKSSSELYYGPSSNFSLMQQLYRQLSHQHGVGLQSSPGYVQDAGDGLDEFHYRNVCFNSQLANLDRPAYENAPTDPPRYLDAYFETIGVLFPIVREEDLRARLPHLEAPDRLALAPLDRAVLLAALATGALFCGAKDEGEGLLQMAHKIADEYRHIINNEVVIFNFLMISRFFCPPEDKTKTFAKFLAHALFYDCTGRYNLAYLHNGHACRAAHAVGLHQTSWISSNSMASDPLGPTVYCAVFVQESFLCTALGRPAALQALTVQVPQDMPFLKVFFQLAKISTAIKQMHEDTDQSLEALTKTRDLLLHHLGDVVRYVDDSLGIDLTRRMQVKDCGVHPMLLKLEYELAVMLLHRPLLIIQIVSTRFPELACGANDALPCTAVTAKADEVQEPAEAVRAARRLIELAEDILYEKSPALVGFQLATFLVSSAYSHQHFSKVAFYLESACLVLVFDSLNSKEPLILNSSHIEKAVDVLAKLTNKTSVLDMIVGIRTMLDRTLATALSTMFQNSNLPAETPVGLEETTDAVNIGLKPPDMTTQSE